MAQPKDIDLGPKQRALVDQIQRDEGYLRHLEQEIKATEERINKNKGKLEFIAEFAEEYGDKIEQVPPAPSIP